MNPARTLITKKLSDVKGHFQLIIHKIRQETTGFQITRIQNNNANDQKSTTNRSSSIIGYLFSVNPADEFTLATENNMLRKNRIHIVHRTIYINNPSNVSKKFTKIVISNPSYLLSLVNNSILGKAFKTPRVENLRSKTNVSISSQSMNFAL
jgi:hypothetical protein